MSGKSKIEEVQFYLDRSLDALVTLLRSIIDNPRVPDTERVEALRKLADHHGSIANFIFARISAGEQQGLERRAAEEASSKAPTPG